MFRINLCNYCALGISSQKGAGMKISKPAAKADLIDASSASLHAELQLKQLRPYVSVVLYDLRDWSNRCEELANEVEAYIEGTISSTHQQGDRLKDYGPIKRTTFSRWITRGRWHGVQTLPSWLAEVNTSAHEDGNKNENATLLIDSALRDLRHHL